MNRREFLQCVAIIVGGTSAGFPALALSEGQRVYLAAAPNYIDKKADYFSASEKALVSAVAETIIPSNETLGAIEAKTPRFIELMVFEWLTADERDTFLSGLKELESMVAKSYKKTFSMLTKLERIKVLESMEILTLDSDWYHKGNFLRAFVSDAPFICQIKELTIWGFFTSEVGATQVLRYDAMPMKFDGSTKLKKEESSWAIQI